MYLKFWIKLNVMIDLAKARVGDRVHYIPYEGCDESSIQNGLVKEIPEHTNSEVRVVFNCAGDWDNFQNYTSQLTSVRKLRMGWKN
jgi:hypothetical protein